MCYIVTVLRLPSVLLLLRLCPSPFVHIQCACVCAVCAVCCVLCVCVSLCIYESWSMRLALSPPLAPPPQFCVAAPPSLKMLSTTLISVDVVSMPTNPHQSLTTTPPPSTSDPLLIVPATSGTCSKELSSSISSTDVRGWTRPPTFVNLQYEPTSAFPATVCLKTSTPRTSAIISSVSRSMSVCTSAT